MNDSFEKSRHMNPVENTASILKARGKQFGTSREPNTRNSNRLLAQKIDVTQSGNNGVTEGDPLLLQKSMGNRATELDMVNTRHKANSITR